MGKNAGRHKPSIAPSAGVGKSFSGRRGLGFDACVHDGKMTGNWGFRSCPQVQGSAGGAGEKLWMTGVLAAQESLILLGCSAP